MKTVTQSMLRRFSIGVLILLTVSSAGMFQLVHAQSETNTVQNGDFSNGLASWTTVKVTTSTGARGEYPIFEVLTQGPGPSQTCFPSERLGNPFLNIEVPFGADGYAEQEVAVPASGGQLSFLSWGWEGSNPDLGFSGLVNAYVRIVDASSVEHTLETYTPPPMFIPGGGIVPDVCTGNSPVPKSYDLSTYSSQTVKLRLGATSQNCCGTNAFFDDVQLTGPKPDFEISVSPESRKVFQGKETQFQIAVRGFNGFDLPVLLECLTCQSPEIARSMFIKFDPELGKTTPPFETSLRIMTLSSTPTGEYKFLIKGTATNGLERFATVGLTVWSKFALVVGVNQYDDFPTCFALANLVRASNNVCGAVESATDVYDVLTKQFGFPKYNVRLRTDNVGVGQDNVNGSILTFLNDLLWLTITTHEDDIVVIYVAAHGNRDNLGEYLVLHDSYMLDRHLASAINGIKSRSLLIVLDVSFGGGFIRDDLNKDGKVDNEEWSDLALGKDGKPADGRIVLTGCGEVGTGIFSMALEDCTALLFRFIGYEMTFSHFLVEAFRGGDLNRDGKITVEEAFSYVVNRSIMGTIRSFQKPQMFDAYPTFKSFSTQEMFLGAS